MRALLAGLLGSAAGASGRDIPAYREYSQPISFYDDNGERTDFASVAPDVAALRSVRDVQAQEALMGKETLLDMTFGKGESVFAKTGPLPGKLTPPASGRDETRSGSNSSGQNWLSKSLSLPSLGQASTNAAAAAISAGTTESSWGWLADEVVGAPGLPEELPEELSPEETYDPARAQNKEVPGSEDLRGPAGLAAKANPANAEPGSPGAAADREAGVQAQTPTDRGMARNGASDRNVSGGNELASATRRNSPAMAEMSQTRQMIAEFSAGARPDFASWREALATPSAEMPGKAVSAPSGPSSAVTLSGQSGSGGWGAMDNRPIISSGAGSYASPGSSAWQGSWRAQSASESRLSPFEVAPTPIEAVVPAATPAATRSNPFGGGYKPAWY